MPQIELMQSDLPHTLYNFKSKDEGHNVVTEIDEDAIRLNEESIRKMREKRRKRRQERGYTIDEIFNGAADED